MTITFVLLIDSTQLFGGITSSSLEQTHDSGSFCSSLSAMDRDGDKGKDKFCA